MKKARRPAQRVHQRGASLVIAIIALLTMTFAGLALIRSVDTGTVIAGNLAFRQGSLHASDVGVEAAMTTLDTIVATSLNAQYPAGCAAAACNYHPLKQAVNTSGVPTVANWSLVPTTIVDNSYAVQFVIDRMCDGPLPVADIVLKCMHTESTGVGSRKAGAVSFTSARQVYYRATIRVMGPRNTNSVVQVFFAR
jgi:Tfp pilus assembly protein PilX